jgi:phosphoribosyl-AMP cyclohydrolase
MSDPTQPSDWLDQVVWNAEGLIPVITQEAATGKVLMLAWMNRAALELTAQEGQAVYWSRSRGRIWRKGESSGNVQHVREIRLDCDSDTVLLIVEQHGGIACHTGRQHCFFQQWRDGHWTTVEPVLKDPHDIYSD